MKKYLFIIICIAISYTVSAQKSATINPGTTGYVWGTASDTLIASDTLDITLRVKGEDRASLLFDLYVTKVSGTVTSNFIFAGSLDGTNYTNIDTIALSNVSTGSATDLALNSFNYPYLRVRSISGATAQKASYKLYFISRKN